MGFRALALLAALAVIVLSARKLSERRRPAPKDTDAAVPEDMRKCEVCGVHVPRSRALERAGRWFCSPEHLNT